LPSGHEKRSRAVRAASAVSDLYTDDSVPEQRETGIACGLAYMECCDEVWAFTGNGISNGMRRELDRAGQLGKPILEIAEV